jgi:hypothetical protein
VTVLATLREHAAKRRSEASVGNAMSFLREGANIDYRGSKWIAQAALPGTAMTTHEPGM